MISFTYIYVRGYKLVVFPRRRMHFHPTVNFLRKKTVEEELGDASRSPERSPKRNRLLTSSSSDSQSDLSDIDQAKRIVCKPLLKKKNNGIQAFDHSKKSPILSRK